MIGVHSPEFSFEHDVDNVRRAARDRSMPYPMAIDNRVGVWRSFRNSFWPAWYVIDAQGRLRHHTFGEGGYEETETALRQLLTGAGVGSVSQVKHVDTHGIEAPADWVTLRSVEIYLGHGRTFGFASPEGLVGDQPHTYSAPTRLDLGHWAVMGTWTVGRESAALDEAGGRLSCRFHARDVHLVVAPPDQGSTVRIRVLLDGQHPGADHGIDVDSAGHGTIREPRLYQLLRRGGAVTDSTVDSEFLDRGAQVYAFTFG